MFLLVRAVPAQVPSLLTGEASAGLPEAGLVAGALGVIEDPFGKGFDASDVVVERSASSTGAPSSSVGVSCA